MTGCILYLQSAEWWFVLPQCTHVDLERDLCVYFLFFGGLVAVFLTRLTLLPAFDVCNSAASLVAVSIAMEMSIALLSVNSSIDNSFLWVASSLIPHTNLSLRASFNVGPKSQYSDSFRSSATYSVTLSPIAWFRL
ncbi:hypothetical protein DPMN_083635 [Dreissena polymorpha]|uniref:Uncharacterized protein n=1 Tax=Dreissena polymorpha TaxID=45954 RepID=A0A9D3Y9N9_DREPO|nr:hypothetical protein DPMN_083635 [Dreissena polymorpha]